MYLEKGGGAETEGERISSGLLAACRARSAARFPTTRANTKSWPLNGLCHLKAPDFFLNHDTCICFLPQTFHAKCSVHMQTLK